MPIKLSSNWGIPHKLIIGCGGVSLFLIFILSINPFFILNRAAFLEIERPISIPVTVQRVKPKRNEFKSEEEVKEERCPSGRANKTLGKAGIKPYLKD